MMKQTLRALIVGWMVMPCGYGQQPVRMEVPAVTAKTQLASKGIAITHSGYTRTEQEGRQMSVKVEVRFFHAPPAPYELQCFFISKNEATHDMQVFDEMKKTAQGQVFEWEFMSTPIAGATRKYTSTPFSGSWVGIGSDGSVTGGGTYGGTHDKYSETSGYKIVGWVVRVVGGGQVLRVESNQPSLQQTAETDAMSKEFNAIAATLPNEDRDGPFRFDTQTGAVIPPGSNPGTIVIPGTIFSTPAPLPPQAPARLAPAARSAPIAPSAPSAVDPAPASVGPLAMNNSDPSSIRLQSPPGKARSPRSRIAEIKDPQETVFLNNMRNRVFQGADWNSLTPEELALVNGLKIADIGLPKDRGFTYFKLYVKIDDSQVVIPPGQLLVTSRLLCADAQGSLAVAQTADTIEVPERGLHQIVLGNNPTNSKIRDRNNGDSCPRNAYVEFRINGKIFRQVLLGNYGPDGWWTMDNLIPERF